MSARDAPPNKPRDPLEDLPKDQEQWPDEEKRREAACPWRLALEQEAGSDESLALLEAIREKLRAGEHGGGAWRTPMGALVVGADETLEVLAHENPYSVREYWKRMSEVHMPMHLGMDAAPAASAPALRGPKRDWPKDYPNQVKPGHYAEESIANAYIYQVGRAEAFCRALELTRREFRKSERETLRDAMKLSTLPGGGRPGSGVRVTVDLWGLAERVIARLSKHWFAIPDGKHIRFGGEPRTLEDEKAYCPSDFVLFSRHVFRPDPDEHVKKQAAVRGRKVMQAATKALARKLPRTNHPFLKHIHHEDMGVVAHRAVGAIDGFVAANWGSFLGVAREWLKGNLWRIQRQHQSDIQRLRAEAAKLAVRLKRKGPLPRDGHLKVLEALLADRKPLLEEVIEVLKSNPVPAWLHRFAVDDATLNETRIRAGERVILHLGRAATDRKKSDEAGDILFGGRYETGPERKYLHACPGRDLAMGVLMGMLVGLLELRDVRKESTVTISFPPTGIAAAPLPPRPIVLPKPGDRVVRALEDQKLTVENHRLWIGVLGFFLPVLAYLFAGALPGDRTKPWLPLWDVSEYYHTSAVWIFCGMLIAMSGFLVTLVGYDWKDVLAARVAGVSGALVALFPTSKSWPANYECDVTMKAQWWPCCSPYVHVTFAGITFVCLIILAVRLFRKSEDDKKYNHPRRERPVEKKFRDDLCLIAGLIMSTGMGWIGAGHTFDGFKKLVRSHDLPFVSGPAGAWMALACMFLSALFSFVLFRSAVKREREATKKPVHHERIGIPLAIIAAIAGAISCTLAMDWLREVTGRIESTMPSETIHGPFEPLIMLLPEVLAIWAFAMSWVIKSQHRWTNPWVDRLRRALARIGWRYKLLAP